MTYDEKMHFVAELIEGVRKDIFLKVPLMPEEWDGHELRRYIADRFELAVLGDYMTNKKSARYRAYRNVINTTNVL